MKRTEIDGQKVVHEFKVLWHLWEGDGWGWITDDGRAWLTNHGRVHEAETSELLDRMNEALSSVTAIHEALTLVAKHREEKEDAAAVGDTG